MHLMRINKERVLPVRLIGVCHPFLHQYLLFFAHPFQDLSILPVEVVVREPQGNHHEDTRSQARHDRYLATDVAGSLLRLERLRAQDVADREGDKREGIDRHFL